MRTDKQLLEICERICERIGNIPMEPEAAATHFLEVAGDLTGAELSRLAELSRIVGEYHQVRAERLETLVGDARRGFRGKRRKAFQRKTGRPDKLDRS